jgi:hypothetical protein
MYLLKNNHIFKFKYNMKHTIKLVFLSIVLILAGCEKTNETPKETKIVEAPIVVTPKEIPTISEDDAKLIKHYGTCATIYKVSIELVKQDGTKLWINDNFAHKAIIFSLLTLQIIDNYPQSLHESGKKIADKFMVENIIGKAVTGFQLTEFLEQNGGCDFQEVPKGMIQDILKNEKEFYDEYYKKYTSQ